MSNCCCGHNHNCVKELESDHEKILEKLKELESAAAETLVNKNKIEDFLSFVRDFAEPHHQKEEKVLFPALENKGIPNEGGPIGVMLFEHETERNFMKELAGALENNDEGKIKEISQTIVALLRDHIDKENNILYPLAKNILTDDELADMGALCEKIKQ